MLYFFDVETGSRFNQLSGHLGPVRDVCWAYDESLLASCDTEVRVGLAWPTAGDGAQCMLDNATGYNNHMEKSQEQQQWQAMNLHNSRKYQLHTHTPPSQRLFFIGTASSSSAGFFLVLASTTACAVNFIFSLLTNSSSEPLSLSAVQQREQRLTVSTPLECSLSHPLVFHTPSLNMDDCEESLGRVMRVLSGGMWLSIFVRNCTNV